MPSCQPPFVVQNRLGNDHCALRAKSGVNKDMRDYHLWNTYTRDNVDPQHKERLSMFSTEHPNIRYKNGYGVASPSVIDDDTDLRLNGLWTHEKAKTQLFTRFYLGNPNLSRGKVCATQESELQQGDDTQRANPCVHIAEKDFDRFTPMIPCLRETIQDPQYVVLPFHQGGEDSRQLMREMQKHLRPCPRMLP